MKQDDLRALWAETCDPDVTDPSLTLSQLPTQQVLPVARARPSVASLLAPGEGRHAARTVDFGAATVDGLPRSYDQTVDPHDEAVDPVFDETMAADDEGRPGPVAAHASAAATAPDPVAAETMLADDAAVGDETMLADDSAVGVGSQSRDGAMVVGHGTMQSQRHQLAQAKTLQLVAGPGSLPAHSPDVARQVASVFELHKKIGEGGMGVIWRARQGSLDREVAVKAIRPEVNNVRTRERFIAEAVVTGGLDHPNVVPVHELGVGEDGQVFLAMKLVHGHAWNDLLHPTTDEQRAFVAGWDIRRHLDILAQVTNAVAFAHSRGIVHRDLKPANIMVGAYGEVVVMDWGIAVDIRMPRPDDCRTTHKLDVHGPGGTPCYMAPELATGRGADIGPWTDVYLLGAILYEIATGTPPHQGKTLIDVLLAASRSEPPTWAETVPHALRQLCERAMAREPASRIQSAEAFAAELRLYVEHEASMRVTAEADALLERLADAAAAPIPRHERYGAWAQAEARFARALELWSGNERARAGAAEAALGLGAEALARGDLGLAEAQLEGIAALVEAKDPRALSLTAALARHRRRGLGSWIGLALGLVAVVALGGWIVTQVRASDRVAQAVARSEAIDDAFAKAWNGLGDGNLAPAAAIIGQPLATLAGTTGATPALRARVEGLTSAHAVALWQRSRWRELWDALCPEAGRGPGTGRLRRSIRALAAVRGTALVTALDDGGARGGADRGALCDVVADAVGAGAPVSAGIAALQVLEELSPDAQDAELRTALRRGALCAVAGPAATCGAAALPFVQQVAGAARPNLPIARRASGGWQVYEVGSAAVRWQTPPPPKKLGTAIAVPRSDGGFVLGEGADLVQRDGATGKMLGRVALPGIALVAWPRLPGRDQIEVAVWSDEAHGKVARVLVDLDWPSVPTWNSDQSALWLRNRPGVDAMADEAFDEAARRLGLPPVLARLHGHAWALAIEILATTAHRDAADPQLVLLALEALPVRLPSALPRPGLGGAGDDAATMVLASELAAAVAARSRAALPVTQVDYALRLDALGFTQIADSMLRRAAGLALEAGHNADAEVRWGDTPGQMLRQAAARRWAAGQPERALALLWAGRRFSTLGPDDGELYQRLGAWAARSGRPLDPELQAALDSASRRDAIAIPHLDAVGIDMGSLLLAGLLPLMLLLWLRLASRSSHARQADLHAAGFRTRWQRWSAWVLHPIERAAFSSVAYASRPERLAMAGLGVLILALAAVLTSEVERISRIHDVPVVLALGQPAHPDRNDLLGAVGQQRSGPQAAAADRLRAESAYVRGAIVEASVALERSLRVEPSDAASCNNQAVILEQQGRVADATAAYTRCAHAAAHWNAARLQGADGRELSRLARMLPWRDHLAAEAAMRAPLWARPSARDVFLVAQGDRTAVLTRLVDALRGDLDELEALLVARLGVHGRSLLIAVLADVLAALLLVGLSVVLLPLTPRRWQLLRGERRSSWLGRVADRLIPGWRWVGAGHAEVGIPVLLAVALGVGAVLAAEGFGPFAQTLAQSRSLGIALDLQAAIERPWPGPVLGCVVLAVLASLLHLGNELLRHRHGPADAAEAADEGTEPRIAA